MNDTQVVKVKKGMGNKFALTFKDQTVILGMDGFHMFSNGDIIELYEFMGLYGITVTTDQGMFNTDILEGNGNYILYQVENEAGDLMHE